MISTVEELLWENAYDDGWKVGHITPHSFAHPAKAARGLLLRIFDHLFATGRLKPGDTVVDPFGGIGTTAIVGASRGCRVVCVELEPKFVRLARGHDCPGSKGAALDLCPDCQKEQAAGWKDGGRGPHHFAGNFDLHRATWERFGDPLPVMLQGDSRKLCEVIKPVLAACVVSSPPFTHQGAGDDRPKGGMKDHPSADRMSPGHGCSHYGTTDGQLGALPAGEVEAVVSSPPYAAENIADARHLHFDDRRRAKCISQKQCDGVPEGYGTTDGQLGAMPAGDVADAVVSSPPYEEGLGHGGTDPAPILVEKRLHSALANNGYGGGPGNLSNDAGETFWSAFRLILLQCHQVLRRGGTMVLICKDFVRARQRVPFSADTVRLAQSCGFRLVQWVRASLVKRTVEAGLFGEAIEKKTERKSFFRRLAEKKGSPKIDHEDVLIFVKDGGSDGGLALSDAVVSSPPFMEKLAMTKEHVASDGIPRTVRVFVRETAPDPKAVGDFIRAARSKAGLSCKEVCQRGGWFGSVNHGGTCANWETARSLPDPEQWVALKSILCFDDDFDEQMTAGCWEEREYAGPFEVDHDSTRLLVGDGYGQTDGQLGAMPSGSVEDATEATP